MGPEWAAIRIGESEVSDSLITPYGVWVFGGKSLPNHSGRFDFRDESTVSAGVRNCTPGPELRSSGPRPDRVQYPFWVLSGRAALDLLACLCVCESG